MTKVAKTRVYSISKVRAADSANQYYITIERDGQPVGDVKVLSSSKSAAYFADDTPYVRPKKEKVA